VVYWIDLGGLPQGSDLETHDDYVELWVMVVMILIKQKLLNSRDKGRRQGKPTESWYY
jgi:hypothetical protein